MTHDGPVGNRPEESRTIVTAEGPPPTPPPPTKPPRKKWGEMSWRERISGLIVLSIVGLIALAVIGAVTRPSTTGPGAAAPRPTATRQPAAPPPAQEGGTLAAGLGDTITISQGGDPSVNVTVERFDHHDSFPGEFSPDEPAAGNVFYAFFVTYEGQAGGGNYNQFDWQAFAGNRAVDTAFVLNAPEPGLSSGSLPNGRSAEGWLVYEGPADPGSVTLSYKGSIFNDEPVFEVTVPCC